MRVIIAGTGSFTDQKLLNEKCNEIFARLSKDGYLSGRISEDVKHMEIVSGCAEGADKLGEQFAKDYGIPVKRFPANWKKYGKKAGYLRNDEMGEYASKDNGVLIAFWDSISKGTSHMIDIARFKFGLKVFVVKYTENK